MSVQSDHFFDALKGNYQHKKHFDVVVIGGGLAALTIVLQLPSDCRIAMVNKSDWQSSSSHLAQGGIAAVLDPADSVDSHIEDTCIAGAGFCDKKQTATILAEASNAISWLQQMGVAFSQTNGQLHLTREGGHSARRIVHSTDATGAAVISALWARAKQCTNITFFNDYQAIDLLKSDDNVAAKCTGVLVCQNNTSKLIALLTPHVVLATGGSGQLYPRTSNPQGTTADGQAMAWRAGCTLKNLEFIQFHPTGLSAAAVDDNAQCPLISEALRGEGAWLCLPDGQRFMPKYDARAELAPRDIVARAIYQEMQEHQLDHVLLDIRHRGRDFIEQHFPTVVALCRRVGIDPVIEPIPVAPLAHYACGGIVTDAHGQSDLTGLYAIGECAYTGLHGANRLASNSLLECLVMAHNASQAIIAKQAKQPAHNADSINVHQTELTQPLSNSTAINDDFISHHQEIRQNLQNIMWQGAGIVRTKKGLQESYQQIATMRLNFQAVGVPQQLTTAWLELRNLLDMALLTLEAALQRPDSCGAHFVKY